MSAKAISNAETKFYIGTKSAASSAATDTYKEVSGVVDIEAFGDKSESITDKVLGEARVLKGKGTRDAGSFGLTVLLDEDDAGQDAMRDAEADGNGDYNFKVVYVNGKGRYLRGFVSGAEDQAGGADVNLKVKFTIELNAKPVAF